MAARSNSGPTARMSATATESATSRASQIVGTSDALTTCARVAEIRPRRSAADKSAADVPRSSIKIASLTPMLNARVRTPSTTARFPSEDLAPTWAAKSTAVFSSVSTSKSAASRRPHAVEAWRLEGVILRAVTATSKASSPSTSPMPASRCASASATPSRGATTSSNIDSTSSARAASPISGSQVRSSSRPYECENRPYGNAVSPS